MFGLLHPTTGSRQSLAAAVQAASRHSTWGSDDRWYGYVVILESLGRGFSRKITGNQFPGFALVLKKDALARGVAITADPYPDAPRPRASDPYNTPPADMQKAPTIFEMPEVWLGVAGIGAAIWWWRRRNQ